MVTSRKTFLSGMLNGYSVNPTATYYGYGIHIVALVAVCDLHIAVPGGVHGTGLRAVCRLRPGGRGAALSQNPPVQSRGLRKRLILPRT